jgi:hypothetical protein
MILLVLVFYEFFVWLLKTLFITFFLIFQSAAIFRSRLHKDYFKEIL